MANKKIEEAVQAVSGMLNIMGRNDKAFCELMENEHRTLQQSFTRLCVTWLEYCASDDYRTDGRNQASKDLAKRIIDAVPDRGLPTI